MCYNVYCIYSAVEQLSSTLHNCIYIVCTADRTKRNEEVDFKLKNITRPHRSAAYCYTYGVVGVSVCLIVTGVSSTKTDEPIEM